MAWRKLSPLGELPSIKKIILKNKFIIYFFNFILNSGDRAAHSCEIIDNKMYIFGGWNG